MVQAVLEGIALLTAGLIDAAEASIGRIEEISIDGGLSQSDYFARFLANASGRTVCVPAMHEMTSLGLAELCGADVAQLRSAACTFEVDGSVTAHHHELFAAAISHSRDWRR